MRIEDKLEAIELYEIYSPLLSDKQREIFEYYYFEDMSIIEIADIFEVSKNAVFKSLKTINSKNEKFEENLKVLSNRKENIRLLKENDINEQIIQLIK